MAAIRLAVCLAAALLCGCRTPGPAELGKPAPLPRVPATPLAIANRIMVSLCIESPLARPGRRTLVVSLPAGEPVLVALQRHLTAKLGKLPGTTVTSTAATGAADFVLRLDGSRHGVARLALELVNAEGRQVWRYAQPVQPVTGGAPGTATESGRRH